MKRFHWPSLLVGFLLGCGALLLPTALRYRTVVESTRGYPEIIRIDRITGEAVTYYPHSQE